MKKRQFRGVDPVIMLILLGVFAYQVLKAYQKDVQYWAELPEDVKNLSISLELERLFCSFPDAEKTFSDGLTADSVYHSIVLGADWLILMQEENGRFNYWFDPVNNTYSTPDDDNFLRQAGTCYSLTMVYEITHQKKYLEAARKNMEYLLQYRVRLDRDTFFFLFNGKAKLGGLALPMLAMLKIKELENDSAYDHTLISLANMIGLLQDKFNTGRFKSTYIYRGDYEYEKTSGWHSMIYPGEAMLALAKMYKLFGNSEYKERFEWAFNYYAGEKSRWKSLSFLPWTVSACTEMYYYTGEQKYADFAFEMTDYMLYWQNLNPERVVYGSFFGLPDVFSSTYLEALGDAVALARKLNNKKRVDLYAYRSQIGYNWILTLQYGKKEIMQKKLPPEALGGFRTSLHEPLIRIDNTQHSLSALVKGIKYIYNQ